MDHITLKFRDRVVAFSDEFIQARCELAELERQIDEENKRLEPIWERSQAARNRLYAVEKAIGVLSELGPFGLLEIEPIGHPAVTPENIDDIRLKFRNSAKSK